MNREEGVDQAEAQADQEPLVAIAAHVPNLLQDIVTPLRARGIREDMIVRLGGESRKSDLHGHTHWETEKG